jgi:hypothetical protein
MKFFDQQMHGYRHGHQLLSASIKLPKPDQDVVDRLSDVAGPLRPGERFDPYLTCYPLPSGAYYVIARTWQDLDAPRAGCVRTRSLILPMSEWMAGVDVADLAETLSEGGPSAPAERVAQGLLPQPLPHVAISQGVELVEALFLEDRKPIVVFDAPDPEGVTLRLLTAFWPHFRRTFAASTFALSPRSLGGRNFDLVFAPKDARPRFSDWPGRRIDARKPTGARHRWSHEIVDRIFGGDRPSLLRDDTLGALSLGSGGAEAELRISLLWEELYEKLQTSPNAALGLLDIANSRSIRNMDAIRRLEPELGSAAQRAASTLPPIEAWRFLLALTDKLRDVRLQLSVAKAIRGAAVHLASRAPLDALANVDMLATARGHELLLGAVGDGVARGFDTERAAAIAEFDPATLLQLLLLSPALAEVSLTRYPALSTRLATALADAPSATLEGAKRRLLRLLVDDEQADAARVLIAALDSDELLAEAKQLSAANGFAAESLHVPLAERARESGAVPALRDTVAGLPESGGADALLLHLISPVRDGFQWLLETPMLAEKRRLDLLRRWMRSTPNGQFKSMIVDRERDSALRLLMQDPAGSLDIVERMLEDEGMDASTAVHTTMRLLPYAPDERAQRLASRALEIILPRNTGTGRDAALDRLLEIMGPSLDASRTIRAGLQRTAPGEIVAANLSAFNRSAPGVRQRILSAIEDLARAIVARGRIDYPEYAAADAASLLWDSAALDQGAFVRSSATLLPFLLQSVREPASPLIAAAFPSVYQELKKADGPPDFFKFFLFVDWDKCKIARRELVNALMHSNWKATDIALAAVRARDPVRILGRIAKQDGGARVIADIESGLSLIPDPWRGQVKESLDVVRSGRPVADA